jgi:hypothetical protein
MVFHARNRTLKIALAIGLAAVAVRFIGINQPFVDDWSWRQSDVATIARNFSLNGFCFAYPQIDWAGGEPGYVGTEFPILPFLAAVAYRFVGIHEWVGRIQAVLLFAVSLPFFFLLVRRLSDDASALWALLFYSFAPLQLMASRCFMPDVPSLALSIVGLYLFVRWTETDWPALFAWAALATSLAILIKVPTILIGVPLAAIVFSRFGFSAFRRGSLWLFAAIVLLPSVAWYWHAHRISEQFYPYHFFGAGGFKIESLSWYAKIVWRTIWSGLTIILFALAMAGLVASWHDRRFQLFRWWGGALILFLIFAGYGNRHPWYQLTFVPIGAALAGKFCSAMASRYSGRRPVVRTMAAVVVIAFGFFSYHGARSFYRETAADLRRLGLELKASTAAGSLVVVADYGDPTVFYYAERKGWHFMEIGGIYGGHPTNSADAIADLEGLRRRGATHIAFYSGSFWWLDYYKEFAQELDATAMIVVNDRQLRIYRLRAKSE